MDDDMKEEPAQTITPKFLAKAGWVKKATSRLLGSYKERYVHVEKTEVVVYENEELQVCLERLDLEKYDKCRELRSAFKRKNRLILIAASKSGNKVHDVKFQAQTAEEKEAWIKALSDGIDRAKNKIFDEVTVDDDNGLEHVTRTRPKGNRNRRPPTRIHMKEVASVSSDGILRLDLDFEGAMMPNGSHYVGADGTDAPAVPTTLAAEPEEEEPQTEPQPDPPKKILKPPMPPSKEGKTTTTPEEEPDKVDAPEKKVLTPPLPPSKQSKPCAPPAEDTAKEDKTEEASHKSADATKKSGPPPTLPSKPVSNSTSNHTEDAQLPTLPSKDKKPSKAVEWTIEGPPCASDVTLHAEDDEKKETTGSPVKLTVKEPSPLICDVRDDPTESTSTEERSEVSEGDDGSLSIVSNKTPNNETQTSDQLTVTQSPSVIPEPGRKNPSTPVPPKKKPVKVPQPAAVAQSDSCPPLTKCVDDKMTIITQLPEEQAPASDTSVSSVQAEETQNLPVESKSDVPAIVVSLNIANSPNLSPLLGHVREEKKAEEKSVDSGQHSDADSDGFEGEDSLGASTAALKGSHVGLDALSISEDEMQISNSLKVTQSTSQAHQSSKVTPLKPSAKAKSASIGDLLSGFSGCTQMKPSPKMMALADGVAAPRDNVTSLVNEVALEMEKTSELLSRMSQLQGSSAGESVPEELLDKAMEKMTEVDHFLRKLKKYKDSSARKNSSNRNSW